MNEDNSKVFVAPKRRHDEVYEAYGESSKYWKDVAAVIKTSPLRNLVVNATSMSSALAKIVWLSKIDTATVDATIDIISKIVNDAVAIFDEWDNECGTDPQPETVFEAYRDSDAIWDAYEWFIDYSPINWLRSRILGWVGTVFPTTRIGEWATLLQADHYLVGLDNLIKDILEHALDAYADTQVVL